MLVVIPAKAEIYKLLDSGSQAGMTILDMPRTCALCGKTSQLTTVRVKLRGKFNPTTKKRQYPNLQWVRLASGKRVKACVKCIKTLHKTK